MHSNMPTDKASNITPSNPLFDRWKYNDKEFIELLLFEIKELQYLIKERDRVIENLSRLSPSINKAPAEVGILPASSPNDVPQRSARRRLSLMNVPTSSEKAESDSESVVSVTSNGPIAALDGMPLSKNFKKELSTATSKSISLEGPDDTIAHEITFDCPEDTQFDDQGSQSEPLAPEADSSIDLKHTSSSVYKSKIRLPQTLERFTSRGSDLKADDSHSVEARSLRRPSTTPSNGLYTEKHVGQGFPSPQLSVDLPYTIPSEDVTTHRRSQNSTAPLAHPHLNSEPASSPSSHPFRSSDSIASPASNFSGSTFQVIRPKRSEEELVALFVKPEEFYSIRIEVSSTIATPSRRFDEPYCTFCVNDYESGKEMWRIRKSLSQISAFDNDIRPTIEVFGISQLPDKSLFGSSAPQKVAVRKQALQDYCDDLFKIPHIPQMILFRICKFLSLNIVNPLDDYKSGARKEGFLIRRYKGLGTTWKVRWCQVDGPALEIYDFPGGNLLEHIVLLGSQIGRQSSDAIAEEKGYRHAFLILENSKSSKISSYPKHFFCAESDEERDMWVAAMVEFTENDPLAKGRDSPPSNFETDTLPTHVNATHYMPSQHDTMENAGGSVETSASAEPKDQKKLRKRALFQFRSKRTDDYQEQDDSTHTMNERPMTSYLEQMSLNNEMQNRVFGRDIEEAVSLSAHRLWEKSVPSVCFRCFDFLLRTGAIYEEGIFRLSGLASNIRLLKDAFNSSFDIDLFECAIKPDMHTVSGLLKSYFRELPTNIFGEEAYLRMQSMITRYGDQQRGNLAKRYRDLLRNDGCLSATRFNVCYVLFRFLNMVTAQSIDNKMTLKNVCIVFVPTLNLSVDVVSLCITDFHCIFEGGNPLAEEDRENVDLQIPTF